MKIIQFRKLRLFKSDEILPLQKKMEKSEQKKKIQVGRIINSPVFYLILFSAIISFLISFFPTRPLPLIQVGEIATKDLVSPIELTVEDAQATEKRKSQAEEAIPPVYFYNQKIISSTQEKIKEFFETGQTLISSNPSISAREIEKNISENLGIDLDENTLNSLIKLRFSTELQQLLSDVLTPILSQEIILSRSLLTHGEMEKGLLVIRGKEEKLVKPGEIMELKEARNLLVSEINALDLPLRTKNILKALGPTFLAPTINYDQNETDIRRLRARNSVEPVSYTIKKGKIIIRKGDEATAETIKQILLINQKIKSQPHWLINFFGLLVLYSIILFFIWQFIIYSVREENKLLFLVMIGLTLLISFLAYKASLFIAEALGSSSSIISLEKESLVYAFPFQLGTFLFAFLTTTELSIVYTVINSLLAAYLLNGDYFLLLFVLLGGLAVIYGIKVYISSARSAILKTGLLVLSPFQVILVIIIHLIQQSFGNFSSLSTEIFSGLIGGWLSAAVAYVLMPAYEVSFGFLTPTKLNELTNSDRQIFRQMALEAPGTYHHSLIVSALAEKAAEEIKADSFLVKAGGLYHDIGKLKRPEYFSENQNPGYDLHRELTPSLSTLVIINHVKDGVDMAKKLKLPRRIIEIIAQHHGTSVVRYFFQKAQEKYDPELHKIEEEDYRYPGPTPKSKEAGLILLADSVEAAARSLKSPTKQNLKRVIIEIFNAHLQDGQLDDCGFSLKDLRIIANSFLATLYAIYHPRPSYPGFDFEKKEEKKEGNKKSNGHNHQSTEEKPNSPKKA
jgi:putative nucleotidyltransferase with HDIG domain